MDFDISIFIGVFFGVLISQLYRIAENEYREMQYFINQISFLQKHAIIRGLKLTDFESLEQFRTRILNSLTAPIQIVTFEGSNLHVFDSPEEAKAYSSIRTQPLKKDLH